MELTDGKSEQEVLNVVKKFAEILKREGQLKNAPKIMAKFGELYNTANGIITAEILSMKKLDEKSIHEIGGYIKKKYSGNTVEIKNTVDEKIKGGIVIKVGDEVMDASVANQLRKLKNILIK